MDKIVSEEELIKMLDDFAESEVGRLKVKVTDELKSGEVLKAYHHGRCDIGSPFDCGTAFDVLPDENR